MKQENEYVFYRLAHGIMHVIYKPSVRVSIKAAKKITLDRLMIQKHKAYPVFCDITEANYFTRAARTYFAHEGCLLINALGIMANSPTSEAISAYYLALNPPLKNINVFTEKHLAIHYLSRYR